MNVTLGDMRSTTVDVVGDSHLARLFQSGVRLPVEVNLAQWCRGGAGLAYLEGIVEKMEWEELPRTPQVSDVTIIFIGGNDLDRWDCNIQQLVTRYVSLCDRLARLGSRVVMLTQWPRPSARIGGVNFRVNQLYFNHLLQDQAHHFVVWSWDRRLRTGGEGFFGRDGVHCSPAMFKRVMRYFTAAVFAGLRAIYYRRQRFDV